MTKLTVTITVRPARRRLFAAGFALYLAMAPGVRADGLPDLGDASQSSFSPQAERKVGEQIFNEIRTREPTYVADAEIGSYLNRIGGRLASHADGGSGDVSGAQGFTFFALRDPTMNAFAMPGGYIGVHTGLITSAQSESELASVLAHEISHVTQRHIARSFSTAGAGQAAMLLALAVAILAARSNPDVAMGAALAGQAAAIQNKLNYSRDFEREADRIGLHLLQRAEFDARAMPGFFNRLLKASSLYETSAPAYLRTHPLTTERIAAIEDRLVGHKHGYVADSLEFQLVRAKLRASAGAPRDAVAEFETRLDPKLPVAALVARYGLVRALLADGSEAQALAQWELLEKERKRAQLVSPMFDTLAAEVSLRRGDATAAVRTLVSSHAHYPRERAVNYLLVEAHLAAGNYPQALDVTRADLHNVPDDPQVHALQAKTYALLGQRAQQHRAQGEAYLLLGNLAGAVEQFDLAQRANDGNFYEHSQIDARLRELRARQLDELRAKRGIKPPEG